MVWTDRIIHIGTERVEDMELKKKIILTNSICLITGSMLFFNAFTLLMLNSKIGFAFCLGYFAPNLTAIFVNHLGKFNLSRYIMTFVMYLGTVHFAIQFGPYYNLQYILIVYSCVPFLLFTYSEKWISISLALVAVVLFASLTVTDYFWAAEYNYHPQRETIRLFFFASVFFLSIGQAYYQFHSHHLIEVKLNKVIEEEVLLKKELEQSQEELLANIDQLQKLEMELEMRVLERSNELEKSQESFNLAMAGSNDGFWDWYDINESKVWWSDRMFKLLGYEPNEIQFSFDAFINLIHEEDRNQFTTKLEEHFLNKAPFKTEYRLQSKSGEYRWFLGRGQALWDQEGHPVRMSGSISDIHEKKLADDKIKEVNIQLKRSLEFKSAFLAQMSHEIRTPMNGITGLIDVLADSGELTAKQNDLINTIQSSSKDLIHIINEVLDISKIEAGKMTLTPQREDFHKTISQIEALFKEKAKQKGLDFTISLAPQVHQWFQFDKFRLSQVINNLISNAIKFTNSGTVELKIALKSDEHKAQRLLFEIIDTGPGIPKNELSTIFNKYEQLQSTTTRLADGSIGGTGLGLSICQGILELMDSQLHCKSEFRKGSNFYFEVKLNKEFEKSLTPEQVEKDRQLFELNILLVEDKLVNQKVAQLLLQSMGCQVDIANNGEEALFQFKQNQEKYDLIFMDIQMPVMDGITATVELKRNFEKVPPIVALSANNMEGDKEKYIQQGLDDYISKPINKEKITSFLASLKKE